MSRSLRRGAVAASAIVVSIAALSACGAGSNAQTLAVKPDNAATSVGDLQVQNATVITQPKANAKGPAVVTARIFNNGIRSQTLDAISLPGTSARVKVSAAKGAGPVTVPANGSIILGGRNNPSAVIADGRTVTVGNAQRAVFDFSETGKVSLLALVVPATGYFSSYGPSTQPATPRPSGASPSGSATPSRSAPRAGSATATPTR
jgi:hypothetical protein